MFLKYLFLFFFTLENIYATHDHGVKHCNGGKGKDNEVIKVVVLYESLCPYSIMFYTGEFKDVVIELCQYLDTKVDENGHITITCQHGVDECYGNKLHGCAIDSLKNITAAIIYNSCLMDNKMSNGMSNDLAADTCGKLLKVDSKTIKACAKSNKGLQLLKHYGELSGKYQYPGVPAIFINGASYEFDDKKPDFKKTVCKAFKNPPPECSW